jgi:hypothetical protein
LTFNTTSLPLALALKNGLLLQRKPRRPRPGASEIRTLLVTPDIDALLDGRVDYGVFPDVATESLIADFSAGWLVTVSRKKTKRKPTLERLDGFDEVWALCPRVPRPGWRLLGRFYEKDVLVLLRAWPKEGLFSAYAAAAAEVIEAWNEMLGGQAPHRGNEVGDYLSGVLRDVDQQD